MKIDTITSQEFWSAYRIHDRTYWDRMLGEKKPLAPQALIDKQTASMLSHEQKKQLFKENIDTINLELSSFCNRQCIYCPLSDKPRDYSSTIDWAALDTILADLSSVGYCRNITLNLYNEPFANHDFFLRAVRLIRERLPSAVLWTNSNGDYITSSLLSKAELAGLSKLKVTIHPPKGKLFDSLREHRSLNCFLRKIGMESSEEIGNTTDFATCGRLGSLYLAIQAINWSEHGNTRGGAVESITNRVDRRTNPCAKPFREFTIYHDLTVTQCCDAYYDPTQWTQNSLFKTSDYGNIFDAYTSPALSDIRSDLFMHGVKHGICEYCSVHDYSLDESDQRREVRRKLALKAHS